MDVYIVVTIVITALLSNSSNINLLKHPMIKRSSSRLRESISQLLVLVVGFGQVGVGYRGGWLGEVVLVVFTVAGALVVAQF